MTCFYPTLICLMKTNLYNSTKGLLYGTSLPGVYLIFYNNVTKKVTLDSWLCLKTQSFSVCSIHWWKTSGHIYPWKFLRVQGCFFVLKTSMGSFCERIHRKWIVLFIFLAYDQEVDIGNYNTMYNIRIDIIVKSPLSRHHRCNI